MPRHNLRSIQPMVKEFAAKHKLSFHSYTFVKANGFVLGAMQDVSNQIRAILAAEQSHISNDRSNSLDEREKLILKSREL